MPRGRPRRRILVVDDDRLLTDMVGQMLGRMGYRAVKCTGPQEALTLFSRAPERFDATIVDEDMPGLKGTQLAAQFLMVRNDIPIVLLTGRGDMISLKQVRESGVRATLIKPVLRDELQRALDRVLGPTE